MKGLGGERLTLRPFGETPAKVQEVEHRQFPLAWGSQTAVLASWPGHRQTAR